MVSDVAIKRRLKKDLLLSNNLIFDSEKNLLEFKQKNKNN